jgi:hypothetical protein
LKPPSKAERERLAKLAQSLDERTLRQLLTPQGKRILRKDRLEKLLEGRGRLLDSERDKLQLISRNASSLLSLKQKSQSRQVFKTNRALRDWLTSGKAKGIKFAEQDEAEREKQIQAIKALRFLGVEPESATFYVRKVQA